MTLPITEGLSSSSPARAAEVAQRTRPAKPTPSAACTSMPTLRLRIRICGITLTPKTVNGSRRTAVPVLTPPDLVLYTGSGRFCGTTVPQRFIQQSHHPRNDGDIGQVEHIPAEAPGSDIEVKQHEIQPSGP